MPSDSPSIDGAKEPSELRSGLAWLIRRALPIMLFSLLFGTFAGLFRWATDFLPVIQGMICGGLLGWLAGLLGRRDPVELWGPGQRFWMLLCIQASFAFALLLTLSLLNRPPLAPPLAWLGEVLSGYSGEAFFGASIFNPLNPVEGALSGGYWVAFNLLDNLLFFFLGILAIGIGIEKKGSGKSKRSKEKRPHLARPFARRLFLIQACCLALAFVVLGSSEGRGRDPRLSHEAMAELRGLSGRYAFDDGAYLLGRSGEAGAFILGVQGMDMMLGRSDSAREYIFSLSGRPPDLGGRLYAGRNQTSVRARFSKDGRQLTLAGRVNIAGEGPRDVVVVARRE